MADAGSRTEQGHFRNSLSYFTDPALQRRTLEYATSARVRSHDVPDIISKLMERRWAAATTWDHVKRNWAALEQALGMFQGLPQIVRSTRFVCDAAARNDVERFLNQHPIRGTGRSALRAIETIDRCIATKNAQSKSLAQFLGK